ncbi:hypothetical protein HZS61_004048 [Fusarium oxysporum f. sp. conglutinans]|uniref:Uncharacterized protein n=1 Tax=Fusarium oxysporum f. sp. conglutinans TaxID=100902 RepID=A0A8H6LFA9_FUSOX|nr:hypothetical protein HZS61_004048 [Fusarium oxysporum f. sp. conglutinans]
MDHAKSRDLVRVGVTDACEARGEWMSSTGVRAVSRAKQGVLHTYLVPYLLLRVIFGYKDIKIHLPQLKFSVRR